MNKRVVVTGMAINTPIGDTLDTFLNSLLAGKSAITSWKFTDTARIYGKVGGDLSDYDLEQKIAYFQDKIPTATFERLNKLRKKVPWCISLSLLIAVDGFLDAGLLNEIEAGNTNIATVISGHNLTPNYVFQNHDIFNDEPDFIDGLFSLYGLDTNHAGSITEVLQINGPAYTVGGACASGNMALRSAVDEIRSHDIPVAAVVAPVLDFSPLDIQAMALMEAISYKSFNDMPHKASRPYDKSREGFVPAQGAAVLILEDLERALNRNAKIYAEILGVESSADGTHLPQPSQKGQAQLMRRLLHRCKVKPQEIDYINAHATSTPLGDITEIESIKEVFGEHAYKLKINAPKSMLGHTCWAASTVETVAAILQMQKGMLHPSINIEDIDPKIDLDVCNGTPVKHQINLMMKNSFGFGGLNSISLIKRFDGE